MARGEKWSRIRMEFFYEKENFTNVGENSGKKEKAGI